MPTEGVSQESVKKVVVTKRGNAYYFPKTIPKERYQLGAFYTFISLFVIAGDYISHPTSFSEVLNPYIFNFLGLFSFELFRRTVSLINERHHLTSRYSGNMSNLVKSAYKFNPKVLFSVAPSALYFVWFISTYGISRNSCDKNWYFKWPVMFLLYDILEMNDHPINDSMWIEKNNGLNYGSGMAYSFFYGYLQYVLPNEGNQEKNLQELMQDYESKEQVKFDVYKIFMLIPRTLNCPVSLEERSNLMEMRNSLEAKIKTVAGVKNRVYKNSVYSIKHERTGNHCYVCAEYATPLKTFHNVIMNDTLHTGYYKRHQNDILLQFYLTLEQILKSQNLDNACELVFYDDRAPDPDGGYYDVGKIIFNRIKELNANNRIHQHQD